MTSFRRIGLALVAVAALLMMPLAASAATNGTANLGTNFSGGSLSIGTPADSTFPSVAVAAGTESAAGNSALWSDNTATGAGWNGTIAVQQFHLNQSWVAGTGAMAQVNATSGQYTGTNGAGSYTVTITSVNGSGSTVSYGWTGEEVGTAVDPLTVGFPGAVGTKGVTITFPTGLTTANAGSTYSIKVGNMAASALALNSAATTITPTLNPPVATGGTSTITAGSASSYGTPVKFVSAASGQGQGTYTIVPGVRLTWDAAATWALPYSASASYTIVSGP